MRKPTVDQVREYVERLGYSEVDPEMFVAHYESNGWRVGKVKMIDWRRAVVTWHRMRLHWQKQRQKKPPPMPYRHRENRINYLNRRKAQLMRLPQTPSVLRELERIQTELHKL